MSASICTHISGEVKENDDTQIWLDGTVAASAGETSNIFLCIGSTQEEDAMWLRKKCYDIKFF